MKDVIKAIRTEIVDQPEWKIVESTIQKLALSYSHPSIHDEDDFLGDDQMEGC